MSDSIPPPPPTASMIADWNETWPRRAPRTKRERTLFKSSQRASAPLTRLSDPGDPGQLSELFPGNEDGAPKAGSGARRAGAAGGAAAAKGPPVPAKAPGAQDVENFEPNKAVAPAQRKRKAAAGARGQKKAKAPLRARPEGPAPKRARPPAAAADKKGPATSE